MSYPTNGLETLIGIVSLLVGVPILVRCFPMIVVAIFESLTGWRPKYRADASTPVGDRAVAEWRAKHRQSVHDVEASLRECKARERRAEGKNWL